MTALADLADLLGRLDPPPPRARTSGVVAGALLGVEATPMELVAEEGAPVRAAGGLWRSDALLVEIGDRVTGVAADGIDRVEVHTCEGVTEVRPDHLGGFAARRPPGLVRLVAHPAAGRPLVSPWLR